MRSHPPLPMNLRDNGVALGGRVSGVENRFIPGAGNTPVGLGPLPLMDEDEAMDRFQRSKCTVVMFLR